MLVKLVKSPITQPPAQRKTLKALGLGKVNQVQTLPDNDCVKGMVRKVAHLVEVVNS